MPQLTGVRLAERTTLRLGGPAARLVEAATEAAVVTAVTDADREGEAVLVLGGGSNVVVADEGFDGLVVVVATDGVTEEPGEAGAVHVTAAAGMDWDALVARTVAGGLSGLEALSGIPGLVGATPIQNVGAYGQEVSDTVVAARVLDRSSGEIATVSAGELRFAYRSSALKGSSRYVVLDVTYALLPGGESRPVRYAELARTLGTEVGQTAPVATVRDAVLQLRRRKGMVLDRDDHDTWSAGSFFTNPLVPDEVARTLPDGTPTWPAAGGRVKVPAAWLIEHAGFGRGYGSGPVRLSDKHTLALTNRGGARTADLLALAREIRAGVLERFGIELVPEPVLVGCSL